MASCNDDSDCSKRDCATKTTESCRAMLRQWLLIAVAVTIASSLAPKPLIADEPLPPEPPLSATDRDHWAFRPLERPRVPQIATETARLKDWPRQPLDAFVLSRLIQARLEPAPEADRITLIRRVSFDLTGLPPRPEAVDEFLNDTQPDAYERLVERLLASPSYGERWAQHWLDLARFAETDGFEHDKTRPEAWRYREWVIDSLNADLPYDEFVRQQLAGDEISSELRVATGFLVSGPDMPDLNVQDERRTVFLNDLTGTVSSTLLGLQIGCAQCHDHKYDPLSQHDFYRLRAFFDRAFDFKRDVLMAPLSGNKYDIPTAFLIRGDFRRPSMNVEPAFIRVANRADDRPRVSPDRSNLRSELARWVTRPDHPLTTRVMMNRLWQFHFGEGLSSTASDFGVMGDSPLHAELLDWLATELPRRNWSLKEMHRMLVTSATYRMTSRLAEDADAATVANWKRATKEDGLLRLLSRQRRKRLDGEAIRDAMLSVTGLLNERRGGQGVRPPLPPELIATLLKSQWVLSEDKADWNRRSIYLFQRRNLRYPLFEAFDRPDGNASCPRRNRSTIAPQALFLLNSELSYDLAKTFAASLKTQGGTTAASRIDSAYRTALGRLPTETERRLALDFVSDADTAASDRKLTDFCLALFNLSEFIYVD